MNAYSFLLCYFEFGFTNPMFAKEQDTSIVFTVFLCYNSLINCRFISLTHMSTAGKRLFLTLCRVQNLRSEILFVSRKENNRMDQKKIGSFLRKLRTAKGLTQEQLAEKLNVSGRTVSRWENGNNMPDLSIIVELADFYDVDIRELLNGERKSEKMNEDLKETSLKMADYAEAEKQLLTKRLRIFSLIGLLSLLTALVFVGLKFEQINPLLACIEYTCFGLAVGGLNAGVFISTGVPAKIRSNPRGRRIAKAIGIICLVIIIIGVILCAVLSIN